MRKLLFGIAAILTLVLVTSAAWGACHVITPNGSGTKSGSDWNNACSWFSGNCSMSSGAVRGDTYYIAKGAYSGTTLGKANSGTLSITIKSPTAADHCTDTGFVQGTHVGQADIAGGFFITSDRWVVDGQYGTEVPETGKGTYGIKVHWNGGNGSHRFNLNTGGSNSTFRYVETQGSNAADTGCDEAVKILGFNVSGGITDVLVEHFYDYRSNTIANPQVADGFILQNSISAENYSTGGCHGENVAINSSNVIIRYNRFINCAGTACIANPSPSGSSFSNWDIYGNVFYDDATRSGSCPGNFSCVGNGIIACIDQGRPSGVRLYNNVVANWLPGHAAGNSLDFWSTASCGSVSGLDIQNNVLYNNEPVNIDASGTCKSNSYYKTTRNSGGCTGDVTGLTSNPFVNPGNTPQDWHLTADTDTWSVLLSPYNLDIDGLTRISSRGAYQFGNLNLPGPPSGLTAQVK